MDFYVAVHSLNQSILEVAYCTNKLTEVEIQKPKRIVRLETSCTLSTETLRTCQVVSAHELYQYKNKFHTVTLREEMSCWLDKLISINGEGMDVTKRLDTKVREY